jgi:type II secretory pathway component PulF
VLLIVVAVSVLGLMVGFVLPRFAGLFETLDMPLPPTTKMLMAFSHLMTHYWWAVLVGLGAAGVAARFWLISSGGRRAVHTFAVRAPQLGKIVRSFSTARISRLLGVLLQSRVPLLTALALTRESCGNMHYEALLAKVEQSVTKGESISAAMGESDLIDASACEAIRNGEKAGRVGDVLVHLADFLDEENEVIVRSLTSVLEPLILIVLGVLVAFVALSTFLPLFDLTSMTQTGG